MLLSDSTARPSRKPYVADVDVSCDVCARCVSSVGGTSSVDKRLRGSPAVFGSILLRLEVRTKNEESSIGEGAIIGD